MLIIDSPAVQAQSGFSINKPSLIAFQKPLIAITLTLATGVLLVPVTIALVHSYQPTGDLLNPAPKQVTADNRETDPTQTILAAQAYLERAIQLSQNQIQTPADREAIVTHLDQALNLANQAVVQAPQSPQSYLIRARVLASSTSIRDDAQSLAQQDLQTAQNLSRGQQVTLPTKVDLLSSSPARQAAIADSIILASPDSGSTASVSAQSDSNLQKLTFTFPAERESVTIKHSSITPDSYIYLIPQQSSAPVLYVQQKSTGSAVISTTQPLTTDLTVEYWIANP